MPSIDDILNNFACGKDNWCIIPYESWVYAIVYPGLRSYVRPIIQSQTGALIWAQIAL